MKRVTNVAKIWRFLLFVASFVLALSLLVQRVSKYRNGFEDFIEGDENECFKDLKCTPKWFNKYVHIHTAILSGILPLRIRIFPASVNGVGDRLRGMTHQFFLALLHGDAFLAEYPSPKDLETDIMQDLFLPRYLFWNRSIATSNLTLTGDAIVDILMDYDPPLMRARRTDVADISHIPDEFLKDVRIGGAYENYSWRVQKYNDSVYSPKRKKKNPKSARMFGLRRVTPETDGLTETDVSELKSFYGRDNVHVIFEESYKYDGLGGCEFKAFAFSALTASTVPRIIKEMLGEMVHDEWLNIGRWTKVLHYLVQIAPRLRTAFAQSLKSLLEQIAEKTNNTEISNFLSNPSSLEKLSLQTPNSFSNYLKSRMSLSIGQLVGLHFRAGDMNAFNYYKDNRHSSSNAALKCFFRCAENLTRQLGYKDPIFVFLSDYMQLRNRISSHAHLFTTKPVIVPELGTNNTFHLHLDNKRREFSKLGYEQTIETWSEFLILSSLDAMLRSDSSFSVAASIFGEMNFFQHKTYFSYTGCFIQPRRKILQL